jgi:S-DNA-T family DNA segregation ATPase FtsK/SpoIIIE
VASFAVIDCKGDGAWDEIDSHPRCSGVVRLHERERLIRVIAMHAVTARGQRVLVIDGVASLRLELEALELSETRLTFERLLTDASLGVTLLVGTDAPSAVPHALITRCANKWVHHLPDAHDGATLGVSAGLVPPLPVPGRLAVARGREVVEAQVARLGPEPFEPPAFADATLDPAVLDCHLDRDLRRARPDLPQVERVETLPVEVAAASLRQASSADGTSSLPIGLRFDTCAPVALDVADGEHVLVIGPGRSGRSTVLLRLLRAWTDANPRGWVGVVAPRRSPLSALVRVTVQDVVEQVPASGPALLVVDDAELVDDPTGAITRLVASRRPGLLVVAAGRAESLRAAYGHWTGLLRRSRLGIVMSGSTDSDADLLGATLPRWSPIPPRPGLGHLVSDGTEVLVQCATDDDGAGVGSTDRATRRGPRRHPTPSSPVAVS